MRIVILPFEMLNTPLKRIFTLFALCVAVGLISTSSTKAEMAGLSLDTITITVDQLSQQLQTMKTRAQRRIEVGDYPGASILKQTSLVDSPLLPQSYQSPSIMFKQSEIEDLRRAFAGIQAPTIQPGVAPVGTQEVKMWPRVAPAFHLNLIMRFARNDWSIWLNNRKFRSQILPQREFKITEVRDDSVTFSWSTTDLDFVSPGWKSKLILLNPPRAPLPEGQEQTDGYYTSKDGLIWVDQRTGTMTFTLTPYQTFVSHTMEIVEGYRNSTVLVDEQGNPLQPPQ